jgi:hypothetical protein
MTLPGLQTWFGHRAQKRPSSTPRSHRPPGLGPQNDAGYFARSVRTTDVLVELAAFSLFHRSCARTPQDPLHCTRFCYRTRTRQPCLTLLWDALICCGECFFRHGGYRGGRSPPHRRVFREFHGRWRILQWREVLTFTAVASGPSIPPSCPLTGWGHLCEH